MQIDELIVSLILDASGFTKGQKDATAAAQKGAAEVAAAASKGEKAQTSAFEAIVAGLNRLATATEKSNERGVQAQKKTIDSNKRVAESFEGAIRTGLTFLAVLAGAKGVVDFTRQITVLDAALGRMAQGLGQAPETLSGIGKAAERMGGDFHGAVGGLRTLSDAFQQLRTTGNSAILEPMARLQALSGKAVTFGKDVHENYLSIADAIEALNRRDPVQADFLGRQILGDESLVNLAKGGRKGVLAAEAESKRHGVVNPEDVAAAQKLQAAYVGLSQTVVDLGTKVETKLTPYLSGLLTKLNDWIDKNRDLIATDITAWVQQFGDWIKDHKGDIEDFGKAVGTIAVAAATVATALAKQSPMVVALEAFAALLTVRLLNPLNAVLAAMKALGSVPLTGALAAAFGANYLANNTMSNVDPWRDQSAGETALRALDPGAADRVYGKRGEQLPHGPRHGVGTHAQPHDTRNLWQRTMPRALGGKDAPEGAAPRETPTERLRRAARRAGSGGPDPVYTPTGPVPGASGYGTTNAYWRGALDAKGEGGHLAPREMFNYLKAQGATDKEALLLTGAASSESSFNPNARHDPDPRTGQFTGHGLFGHKDDRLDMRGKNWQEQSSLALNELRHRSVRGVGKLADLLDRAKTPEEIADVEMHYEAPRGYRPGNPRAGDNYMGRLNSIRRFSAMAGGDRPAPDAVEAPVPPIGDQAALDARQRVASGKPRTGDPALIAEYQRQQNTPAAKPPSHPDDDRSSRARATDVPSVYGWRQSPVQHTKGGGENALTRLYKDGALKVDLTEGSAHRLGQVTVGQAVRQTLHWIGQAQRHRHSPAPALAHPTAAHTAWHGNPHAMAYHRSVMDGARMAAVHRHSTVNHIDRSTTSETKIGSIAVHTRATNAEQMAADIEPIFRRAGEAGRRNYGLA